ncbi:MAG: ABC transporter permease [Treponema sp.]|jgi:simple sugar transport system permease protein|nr:ABC transporter permease [Treponema sp.]
MKNFLPVLHSAVTIMTPLLFAATGGLFTELSGVLNIALEGLLLTGAFFAITAFYFTGSFPAALALAVLAALALSLLIAFFTLKLRSNVFISGLAANLLAGGLTVVLSYSLFYTRGVIVLRDIRHLPLVHIKFIENIPAAGGLLSGHSLYTYFSWLLLFIAWIVIYKTPFGYHLRSSGSHAEALASLGLKPDAFRFAAFLISGFCCGIGGSFLGLNLGAFVPNMPAGKGWMALVVIFMGRRRPLGLFAAAFVFGLADAFSNYAQGVFDVPADFILAIPYLFTLLAMIAVSIWEKRKYRA